MKAIGINIHGKKREFDCKNGSLFCSRMELTSLTMPEGVTNVYCMDNQLTELIIPMGVKKVYCRNNQLTELIFPEGVTQVSCWNNQLTHLTLPDSVKRLWADKEVTGLEKHIGKVEINLR